MPGKLLRLSLALLLLLSIGLIPQGVSPAAAQDVWTAVTNPVSGTSMLLRGVTASDLNTAWAVGDSTTILKFSGGSGWVGQTNISAATLPSVPLYAVDAVDGSTAWAVGAASMAFDGSSSRGTILYTTNGGSTWNAQNSGADVVLRGVAAVNASIAWAVGSSGAIRKTTNAGTTWDPQTNPLGTTNPLNAVDLVVTNAATSPPTVTAWAVGDSGTILKTTDGTGWTSQSIAPENHLFAIAAVDASTAWAVGYTTVTGYGVIFKTTNGGTTWDPQTNGAPTAAGTTLNGVTAVNSTTAWAVGNGGIILKTVDGTNWSPQSATGFTTSLTAIDTADNASAWAVGWNGTILKGGPPAAAGTATVNFSISVQQVNLCVVIDTPNPPTINYGPVPLNGVAVSPAAIVAKNCGGNPEDFLIQGADALGTGADTTWILDEADPIGPGINLYVHSYGDSNGAGATFTPMKKTATSVLAPSVAATTGAKSFYTQIKTPTQTTGSGVRNTTVTVTAVAP